MRPYSHLACEAMFHVKHPARAARGMRELVSGSAVTHAECPIWPPAGLGVLFHVKHAALLERQQTRRSGYPYARHGGTSHVFTHSHFHSTCFSGSLTAYSTPAVNGSTWV